jgi:hypothetical protein
MQFFFFLKEKYTTKCNIVGVSSIYIENALFSILQVSLPWYLFIDDKGDIYTSNQFFEKYLTI